MPDESIHSYLIRMLITLGIATKPNDFRGIVSRKGIVRFNDQHLNYGNYIQELLDKCVFNRLITIHPKLVNGDIDFTQYFQYIFFSRELDETAPLVRRTNIKSELRYCPKCFQLQIKEFGMSWFKVDWLISFKCDEHEIALLDVFRTFTPCCRNSLNVFEHLISTMSGNCCLCGENRWNSEYKPTDFQSLALLLNSLLKLD